MSPQPISEDTTCPRCNRKAELVYVHSHWQCTRCGQVVHDCCDGGDSSNSCNTDGKRT